MRQDGNFGHSTMFLHFCCCGSLEISAHGTLFSLSFFVNRSLISIILVETLYIFATATEEIHIYLVKNPGKHLAVVYCFDLVCCINTFC